MPVFSQSALRALMIFLCLASAAEIRAQTKIGIVDMERVLKEYSKTKEAEAKLSEATKAAKKEFDDRTDAYKKALDEINKLNAQLDTPVLTTEARRQKQRNVTRKSRASKTWSARSMNFARRASNSSSSKPCECARTSSKRSPILFWSA